MRSTPIVSSKGQIVIPAGLRKKYRLEEGVTVVFDEDHGRLTLEPSNFAAFFAPAGDIRRLPVGGDAYVRTGSGARTRG
jgi:AbrB family looped-hinge helix DNA binding protein